MARNYHKNRPTRELIMQTGTRMFLEQGYTNTHCSHITKALGISPGNLTFYFSTKEHLLAELIQLLCDHQWQVMEAFNDDGKSPLYSYCMELVVMAEHCRENPNSKDFYLSAYTLPIPLEIIRRNDTQKAKRVFGEFCPEFSDQDFTYLENLVSGIEYATLSTDLSDEKTFVGMLSHALDSIMRIYRVPDDIRHGKIQKVLAGNYRQVAQNIMKDFTTYVDAITEAALENAVHYLEHHGSSAEIRNGGSPR